jgi:DNA-binding MarR family transcriptional regulator
MTKKKKAEPDLISLSELARRAGVSRAAVTMWVKQQEAQGVILAAPLGRQGKVVDANDKLVMRYINNTAGKSNRAEKSGESAENKSPNTLRKLQYQAEKLRLQNIALREKYVTRESAWAFIDKFSEFEIELFKAWPEKVLRRIETEMKFTIPPDKRKEAKGVMENALKTAHETSQRIIEDFKKRTAPKGTEERTA